MHEYGWMMPEFPTLVEFWICLVKVSQGFESTFSFKYARARNMTRLWIFEGYTRCSICLNKPEYALIMLNILEYACIYLNKLSFEYVRILNVSDAVHSIRLLYKLPSSYRERERERERGVFRKLSKNFAGQTRFHGTKAFP